MWIPFGWHAASVAMHTRDDVDSTALVLPYMSKGMASDVGESYGDVMQHLVREIERRMAEGHRTWKRIGEAVRAWVIDASASGDEPLQLMLTDLPDGKMHKRMEMKRMASAGAELEEPEVEAKRMRLATGSIGEPALGWGADGQLGVSLRMSELGRLGRSRTAL